MPTKMKTHKPVAIPCTRHIPAGSERLPYDRRWMRLRRMVLARHPFCADPFGIHARQGERLVPASQVDHILPRRQGGTDAFKNLQPLCIRCHSRKTALCDGGFGRGKRMARANLRHPGTGTAEGGAHPPKGVCATAAALHRTNTTVDSATDTALQSIYAPKDDHR